jgi:hypothetical protein
MAKDEEVKGKVFNILDAAKPKETRRPRKSTSTTISQKVIGDGAVQVAGNLNINSKQIIRSQITPGPDHITPAQAHRLQELVKDAVESESVSGHYTADQLFSKWYTMLRNRYKVNSYTLIPAELGDQAVKWMQRQVAMLRPKLRRADNPAWRNQHYKAIWSRAKELGFTKDQVYALSGDRLGKTITSLKDLGERNLKSLYNIIMAIPK